MLAGGALKVPSNSGAPQTVRTSTLTIAPSAGSKLDLANNRMIVTASGSTGSWTGAAYTGVTGLVASGRSDGTWDGTGIVTSAAARLSPPKSGANDYTTLGVATAADVLSIAAGATGVWQGQSVRGSDTLIAYTYGGDANLDGVINIDDYSNIDATIAMGGSLKGWFNGDFNYDGDVNIDDYSIIDGNMATQRAPLGGGAAASASLAGMTAVPEPATLSLLTPAAAMLSRRRRRRIKPVS
jgi:hypothetical protein